MPGKRSQQNPRKRRGNGNGTQRGSLLPVYNADPIMTRKFRFQYQHAAAAAATFNINSQQLTVLYGCATTVAHVSSVMSAMRLARVRVWTFGNAGSLSATTSSVTWLSNNGPASEIAVTGNADHPGCLDSRPPANSLANFWYNSNNSANICSLLLNPLDYVEVTLQYTPSNAADGQVPIFTSITALTIASYYYTPLDGASGVLLPVANPLAN